MGALLSPASPGTPPPPPPLPPAAIPPTLATQGVAQAGLNEKARSAAAAGKGMGGTIATSPQGDLTPPSTAKASLLGQTA